MQSHYRRGTQAAFSAKKPGEHASIMAAFLIQRLSRAQVSTGRSASDEKSAPLYYQVIYLPKTIIYIPEESKVSYR